MAIHSYATLLLGTLFLYITASLADSTQVWQPFDDFDIAVQYTGNLTGSFFPPSRLAQQGCPINVIGPYLDDTTLFIGTTESNGWNFNPFNFAFTQPGSVVSVKSTLDPFLFASAAQPPGVNSPDSGKVIIDLTSSKGTTIEHIEFHGEPGYIVQGTASSSVGGNGALAQTSVVPWIGYNCGPNPFPTYNFNWQLFEVKWVLIFTETSSIFTFNSSDTDQGSLFLSYVGIGSQGDIELLTSGANPHFQKGSSGSVGSPNGAVSTEERLKGLFPWFTSATVLITMYLI